MFFGILEKSRKFFVLGRVINLGIFSLFLIMLVCWIGFFLFCKLNEDFIEGVLCIVGFLGGYCRRNLFFLVGLLAFSLSSFESGLVEWFGFGFRLVWIGVVLFCRVSSIILDLDIWRFEMEWDGICFRLLKILGFLGDLRVCFFGLLIVVLIWRLIECRLNKRGFLCFKFCIGE